MTRPVPARTWFGSLIIVVSQAGTLARIEPFYSWHTPIAWTGYILAVDGLVWKRRGSSWLNDGRAELLFLAFVSVPLWVVFELYNKYSIHNWHPSFRICGSLKCRCQGIWVSRRSQSSAS